MKTDFVVAYNICGGSPNATQFQGVVGLPACTPPVATTTTNGTNVTTFGPKGSFNAAISLGKGDIKLAIKGADILNNGTPSNATLQSAAGTVIATSNQCKAGAPPQPAGPPYNADCTSQNLGPLFSAVFNIPCTNGKCSLKSSVNTIIPGTITTGGQANTEISGIGIKDPDGDLAFVSGLFLP